MVGGAGLTAAGVERRTCRFEQRSEASLLTRIVRHSWQGSSTVQRELSPLFVAPDFAVGAGGVACRRKRNGREECDRSVVSLSVKVGMVVIVVVNASGVKAEAHQPCCVVPSLK